MVYLKIKHYWVLIDNYQIKSRLFGCAITVYLQGVQMVTSEAWEMLWPLF